MKKFLSVFLVLAIALALMPISPASAQAYTTSFITSITYQNVDVAATDTLQVLFYDNPDATSPITITCDADGNPCKLLAAGASSSIYIGNLTDITPGLKGSAIMQSDRLLVATLVQIPQSTVVKNRPLSNGFSGGSATVLLATALKNTFNSTTVFSIQNVASVAANVTVDFYNTSAVKVHSMPDTIQPGAALYLDLGGIAALGASFNGSAVINATGVDASTGAIVVTALEMSTNGTAVSAFEGVSTGAKKVYIPSALCEAFGGQNSFYAIQNTSLTTDTSIKVTFSNGNFVTSPVGKGAKVSIAGCSAGNPAGFSGSAIVESTVTDIVAIAKISGTGLSSAFLGLPNGAPRLALPYVRWTQTQYDSGARQRTFIAVQNVGGGQIGIGALSVKFIDHNGATIWTYTNPAAIAIGGKVSITPYNASVAASAEFGYWPTASGLVFGGGALIECTGCDVIATARVTSKVGTSTVGEDYNGIVIP